MRSLLCVALLTVGGWATPLPDPDTVTITQSVSYLMTVPSLQELELRPDYPGNMYFTFAADLSLATGVPPAMEFTPFGLSITSLSGGTPSGGYLGVSYLPTVDDPDLLPVIGGWAIQGEIPPNPGEQLLFNIAVAPGTSQTMTLNFILFGYNPMPVYPADSTPEPATATLALLGLAAMLLSSRISKRRRTLEHPAN